MNQKITVNFRVDTGKFNAAMDKMQNVMIGSGFAEFQRACDNLSLAAFRSAQTFRRYGETVAIIEAMTRRMEHRIWRRRRQCVTFRLNAVLVVMIAAISAVCK